MHESGFMIGPIRLVFLFLTTMLGFECAAENAKLFQSARLPQAILPQAAPQHDTSLLGLNRTSVGLKQYPGGGPAA